MKLLHIDSSALGTNSVSRQLTAQIVAKWNSSHPGTEVDYLDLATDAPSFASGSVNCAGSVLFRKLKRSSASHAQ